MCIDSDILLLGNINAIPELVGRPSSRLDLDRKIQARDPLYFHQLMVSVAVAIPACGSHHSIG